MLMFLEMWILAYIKSRQFAERGESQEQRKIPTSQISLHLNLQQVSLLPYLNFAVMRMREIRKSVSSRPLV
jgi:hypothetical protein